MDVNKICRCCLSNDAPLLTIYKDGATSEDCLAAMFNKLTGLKADPDDKLPDKVCLFCIRDIKNFYAFQKKCEMSHRTLQQLVLSNAEVQLDSPTENLQTKDTIQKEELIIVGEYQITNQDSVKQTQIKVLDDYSPSVMFETNVELTNPINYVNEEMVPADLPIETITRLENCKQTSPSTSEITGIPYKIKLTDTETDSIEFIAETFQVNEPIVAFEDLDETYNTDHNAEVNDITPFSSPQYESEQEIDFIIVNEDFNSDDVERHQINQLKVKKVKPRNITCDICLKHFKTNTNLKCHRRIHTGERPYKCKYCDSTFVQGSTRTIHENTHTRKRIFKCKYCDKSFVNKSNWSNHEKTHTGEKPFKCEFCDKAFIQSGCLTKHYKIHHEENPFKCQFCDKAFIQNGGLRKHYRIHHGEKPFKCQFCDKSFIQSGGLTKHYKMHHAEKSVRRKTKC